LIDLLRQPYPTAWLLLAVLAGLIYAGLSSLPAFAGSKGTDDSAETNKGKNTELSD
jgi:hypothetical protein